MERIERTVLSNLIHNDEYTRRVLPFIKEEYFSDRLEKILFTEIYKFVNKYNALPSKEALSIEMNGSKSVTEDEYKKITDIISTLNNEPVNIEESETEEQLMERLIAEGLKGNMEEINSLDNKVLRGKIKAAIVKAKRNK